MLRKLLLSFGFYIGSLHAFDAEAAKAIPEPPRNYVYDESGVLGPSISNLSSLLAKEDQNTGNQILIAVFQSLEGEDLVDYTNRLFQAWNPGQKGKNNGVVLAAYLAEKKIRFEVGYGLEPYLTDAKSKRIIIEILGPAFRDKKFGEGFIRSAIEIQKIIHQNPEEDKSNKNRHLPKLVDIDPEIIFFIALILFIFIKRMSDTTSDEITSQDARRIRRRRSWTDENSFGGFGGGGSSGGGGFSGGGGSSGGGGASGDW